MVKEKKMTKLEKVARQLLEQWDSGLTIHNELEAMREALDHIADSGKFISQFIPVGIVNEHHSITWMEEIVDDQAPIGAILYALRDSVGRNVSFAKEQK